MRLRDRAAQFIETLGLRPKKIKQLVLEAAAYPLNSLPPTDDTPISAILADPDSITTLTGRCMNYGRFQADGLWMDRLYALSTLVTSAVWAWPLRTQIIKKYQTAETRSKFRLKPADLLLWRRGNPQRVWDLGGLV